jgi:hypothetical protein
MKMSIFVFCAITAGAQDQVQEKRITFIPFQTIVRSQYWTESGRGYESSIKFSRDKDGSFVYEDDVAHPLGETAGARKRWRHSLNVPTRIYTIEEPFLQAAVAEPVPDDTEFERIRSLYGSCRFLEDGTWKRLGESTLLNVPVVEVEVERTDRRVEKWWVAPSIQCFALKATRMIDGQLRMSQEAVSIDLKTPPPGFLDLPAGYTLLSPLDLESHYQTKFPGKQFYGGRAVDMERRYRQAVDASKKRSK